MTKFLITPQLKQVVNESSLSDSQKSKLLSLPYVTHGNLVSFYKMCSPTSTLLELIQMTKISIPVHKEEPRAKSKEFIESMNQLRLKAKEDEYQKLVSRTTNVNQMLYEPSPDDEQLTPAQMHKEVRSHITTIFNIFISVASVVYAIWYWTGSSMRIQDSYRILLCIFFGLLILVAEVVVYMGYLNKIEEAKIAELKKKEIKKLVKSI